MSERLSKEVWTQNICSGCGLCIAACSKQILGWNGESHPTLNPPNKHVGYTELPLDACSFCQRFCEEVCPRLETFTPYDPLLITAGRARGPIMTSAPNGVIQSILAPARSNGLIDGVIMLDLDPWELKPIGKIASYVEEIVACLGPQALWAPVLELLNEAVYQRHMQDLAILGPPCVAQAIRKLKRSNNTRLRPYIDSIRITISTFCTGIYFPEFVDEILIKQNGISPDKVMRLEESPDRNHIGAVLWDGSQHLISRQEAEQYTRPGCAVCDDLLGESADLIVGKIGAPPDSSTIIVRSRIGETFLHNAVRVNLLEIVKGVDEKLLEQAAKEKRKRDPGMERKELRILMLDALADPVKRNEAIQQFIRVYRTPVRSGPDEIAQSDCTGC